MPDRMSAPHSEVQGDSADGGYFTSLASAKRMMLTTFKPDGGQATTAVDGVTEGGRTFFRAWGHSDTVKNLRHSDRVQVAPCAALGLLLLGPPLDAIARPVPDDEASQVAGMLARKYRVKQRFLVPLLHSARRSRMIHYELLADEAVPAATHDQLATDVLHHLSTDPQGAEPGVIRVTVVRASGPPSGLSRG